MFFLTFGTMQSFAGGRFLGFSNIARIDIFDLIDVGRYRRHWWAHGTATFLSVKAFSELEVGGG